MVHDGSDNNESPLLNDNILKEMYVEYDTPCDSVISNPEKLVAFAQTYTDRTSQTVGATQIAHRLLSLRKLGQTKGGLPRIRRRTHHEY